MNAIINLTTQKVQVNNLVHVLPIIFMNIYEIIYILGHKVYTIYVHIMF